jgi:hypothetical protein
MASNQIKDHQGFIGPKPTSRTYEYMKFGDRVHKIHKVTVHEFSIGDVEDPILYASVPLLDWEKSEKGKWVMSHAVETPMWHQMVDHSTFQYRFCVTAKLKDKDYTFWTLKWGSKIT